MESNREKSIIAIAILEKLPIIKGKKIISRFDGSNNIFADCRVLFGLDLNLFLLRFQSPDFKHLQTLPVIGLKHYGSIYVYFIYVETQTIPWLHMSR